MKHLTIACALATCATAVVATPAPAPAPAPVANAHATDIVAIRELRAQNNRALAAHDLDATMQIVGQDFVLVGGNGGIDRSRDDDRKAWAEEFAQPGHDRYVRTPAKIEIGERKAVLRAAESGTWEGTAAKTVLIYDKSINRADYDFFTYSNIRGRAGRLADYALIRDHR